MAAFARNAGREGTGDVPFPAIAQHATESKRRLVKPQLPMGYSNASMSAFVGGMLALLSVDDG